MEKNHGDRDLGGKASAKVCDLMQKAICFAAHQVLSKMFGFLNE
jgi:hypothetical protein